MKKINLTLLLLIFVIAGTVAQTGIKFETGTWAQIQEKAKKENKFIFVDAYTTWCGPCKWMSKNIFPNDTAGKFYNQHFINAKIDMEKGEGKDFATKYDVKFYPSYLFFDSNGELVHRSGGSKRLADFILDGENAIDPNKQLITLQKKYNAGDKSKETVANYARSLAVMNEKNDALAQDYIKAKVEEELYTQEAFEIVLALSSIEKEAGLFILKNREKYVEIVGGDRYNQIIENEFYNRAFVAGEKQDEKLLGEVLDANKSYGGENWQEIKFKMQSVYYLGAKSFTELYTNYQQFYEKFPNQNENEYNNAAWVIFENFNEEEKLNQALVWANKSIEMDKNVMNLDTKANIEFKLGKIKEAKATATEAIKLAKAQKEDAAETQELLKKIEQKLK